MNRSTIAPTLVRAVAVGAIGGIVLGARDGLSTFLANAFADPGNHALAYLLVPTAVWFVLAPLLLLPIALVGRAIGREGTAFLAGAIGVVGTLGVLLPAVDEGFFDVRAVGAAPTLPVIGLVATAVCAITALAGVLTHGVGTLLDVRPRLFRGLVTTAALAGTVSLAWSTWFLASTLVPGVVHDTRAAATPAPDGAPNVLLVSIDTLRADALGAYGNRNGNTPSLDRLATDGVTFERAMSPAPWTLPAVTSILTGLYPRHHGAGAIANRRDPLGRTPLAPGVPTLAEMLERHGYRTHAIVTNPYLLARSGLWAGFESYDNLTFLSEAMLSQRQNAAQWLIDRLAQSLVAGDRGFEVSDRAIRWLESADADRPFFLWLHYIDPHGPYGGPPTDRRKSFRGELELGAGGSAPALDVTSPDPVRLRSGEIRLGDDDKHAMRVLYDREVENVDHQVGRVLDALGQLGLAQNTLVVCVSDHGEEFWEHGGVEHGHTLYDELLHVVFVMRWPGHLPAGTRVGDVTSTIDVVPTIADLVGLSTPAPVDGISLVPTVHGEAPDDRAVLSENLLFAEERTALTMNDARLIRWEDGRIEAYDLQHDPGERRDLAGVDDFVRPLDARLDVIEAALPPRVEPVAGSNIPAAALRALGYVD